MGLFFNCFFGILAAQSIKDYEPRSGMWYLCVAVWLFNLLNIFLELLKLYME
jgi:hypothetical protein